MLKSRFGGFNRYMSSDSERWHCRNFCCVLLERVQVYSGMVQVVQIDNEDRNPNPTSNHKPRISPTLHQLHRLQHFSSTDPNSCHSTSTFSIPPSHSRILFPKHNLSTLKVFFAHGWKKAKWNNSSSRSETSGMWISRLKGMTKRRAGAGMSFNAWKGIIEHTMQKVWVAARWSKFTMNAFQSNLARNPCWLCRINRVKFVA